MRKFQNEYLEKSGNFKSRYHRYGKLKELMEKYGKDCHIVTIPSEPNKVEITRQMLEYGHYKLSKEDAEKVNESIKIYLASKYESEDFERVCENCIYFGVDEKDECKCNVTGRYFMYGDNFRIIAEDCNCFSLKMFYKKSPKPFKA